MGERYYISRKSKLLSDFDKIADGLDLVLRSQYSSDYADSILVETRREFESLIPHLPFIGGAKNRLTESLIGASYSLALYKAMKASGKISEEIAKINSEMWDAYLSSLSKLFKLWFRLLQRVMFTRIGKRILRKQAEESQKRKYPEDFVFAYVKGDGEEFDYGMDFTECAVCKFFDAQGAGEFVPYVCLFDYQMSKFANSGLVRTMTLAEGAEKCDFRFKKGRVPMNKQKTSITL